VEGPSKATSRNAGAKKRIAPAEDQVRFRLEDVVRMVAGDLDDGSLGGSCDVLREQGGKGSGNNDEDAQAAGENGVDSWQGVCRRAALAVRGADPSRRDHFADNDQSFAK
jgi:hypothetical protein